MNPPTRLRFEQLHRMVELLANLGIIAVAVLGCAVLIKQWQPGPVVPVAARRQPARPPAPMVGTGLTLPGVDFSSAEQTLVMVLSTQCHFCTDSAPFYQRLATAAGRARGVRLVALLPQTAEEGRRFLAGLGVTVSAVVQAPLTTANTRGTPTLLLLDARGVVGRVWRGRLSPEAEQQVLDAVTTRAARAGGVP